MNQKLSNKWLWVLFVILIIIGISSFNYKPPCIPAFNTPSYIDSSGVTIVDTTACQPTIPGINDRMLLLAKIISATMAVAAISDLVWILKRRKLNKFYEQNAVQESPANSSNKFVALIKYWVKPILIAIVVIGLLVLGMYLLWTVGLLPSSRY